MLKPYIQDNLLIVEDDVKGLIYEGNAKDCHVARKYLNPDEDQPQLYRFVGLTDYPNNEKPYTAFEFDYVDGSEAGFSNEEEFVSWGSENLGKSASGGGGSQLTADELAGIQGADNLSGDNHVATMNDIGLQNTLDESNEAVDKSILLKRVDESVSISVANQNNGNQSQQDDTGFYYNGKNTVPFSGTLNNGENLDFPSFDNYYTISDNIDQTFRRLPEISLWVGCRIYVYNLNESQAVSFRSSDNSDIIYDNGSLEPEVVISAGTIRNFHNDGTRIIAFP